MCSIFGYLGDSLTKEDVKPYFDRTTSRGPDMQRIIDVPGGILGFERLSIMGLSEEGMQPFSYGGNMIVCNGEIYGFRPVKEELIRKGYTFASDSDCEILLPLYEQYGTEMFRQLDAEFACIIYDHKKGSLIAARDPIGIRPLFYGYTENAQIVFASEAKNLVGLTFKVNPFPPGHYYEDGEFICYDDITKVDSYVKDDIDTVCSKINEKLVKGIAKRLVYSVVQEADRRHIPVIPTCSYARKVLQSEQS